MTTLTRFPDVDPATAATLLAALEAPARTPRKRRVRSLDDVRRPVYLREIGALFGVAELTPAIWRSARDIGFPKEVLRVPARGGSTPVFEYDDLIAWGRRTGRLDENNRPTLDRDRTAPHLPPGVPPLEDCTASCAYCAGSLYRATTRTGILRWRHHPHLPANCGRIPRPAVDPGTASD